MMRYSTGFMVLCVQILKVGITPKERVGSELEVGVEVKVDLELETDYMLMRSADVFFPELRVLLEHFLQITVSHFQRPRLSQ